MYDYLMIRPRMPGNNRVNWFFHMMSGFLFDYMSLGGQVNRDMLLPKSPRFVPVYFSPESM